MWLSSGLVLCEVTFGLNGVVHCLDLVGLWGRFTVKWVCDLFSGSVRSLMNQIGLSRGLVGSLYDQVG